MARILKRSQVFHVIPLSWDTVQSEYGRPSACCKGEMTGWPKEEVFAGVSPPATRFAEMPHRPREIAKFSAATTLRKGERQQ
eukprot:scaffold71790_cov29-Tisochrysis_lutea.AAC.5